MFPSTFTVFRWFAAVVMTVAIITVAGCGDDHAGQNKASGTQGAAATASANYPLDTCVVSGKKLDVMGKPVVITHDGVEVRFCCPDCVQTFNKDPEKYIAKIKDAAAAKAGEKK